MQPDITQRLEQLAHTLMDAAEGGIERLPPYAELIAEEIVRRGVVMNIYTMATTLFICFVLFWAIRHFTQWFGSEEGRDAVYRETGGAFLRGLLVFVCTLAVFLSSIFFLVASHKLIHILTAPNIYVLEQVRSILGL